MTDSGCLIAFEGIDGTGKSTQCQMLKEHLEQEGFCVVALREPTTGTWGQKIRKLLTEGREGVSAEEELQYFLNDRREDVELNILPALKENKVVLIDRYYYSTAAYQGAIGFDPDRIVEQNEEFAPRPDLVLLFELPVDQALKRIQAGRESFSSFEKKEYLSKVYANFNSFEESNFRKVDASQSMEAVFRQVVDQVMPPLRDKKLK